MYVRQTISGSGTEKQFLDAFTGSLVNTGVGITVTDNYTGNFTGNTTPSFTLHFGGLVDILFERNVSNTGYVASSSQFTPAGDIAWGGTYMYDEQGIRTWGYDIIANSDKSIVIVNLGGFEGITDYPQRETTLLLLRGQKNGYVGTSNYRFSVPDPIFASAITIPASNTSITRCNRIPYTYDTSSATNLQIIRSKAFVTTGSTDLAMSILQVFDVSEVPARSLITYNTKIYYALDSHSIMEVDSVATGN